MKQEILTKSDIDQLIQSRDGNILRDAIEIIEEPIIGSVLIHCRGNQTATAYKLGINRSTLRKKMKRLGMLK